MKLNYSYKQLIKIVQGQTIGVVREGCFDSVVYDTRNSTIGKESVFFALKGEFRDGHSFIEDAYQKGIRTFVVSEEVNFGKFPDALFIAVKNVLFSLQYLANYHRNQFKYPVIGITGSAGKTTVKEWLYHLLSNDFKIIRSPKSYNSQLGAALSLLEMTDSHDMAIIEAGISKPGEMEHLQRMIQPTHGIFTSFGSAHSENFKSENLHLDEKLTLFASVNVTFYPEKLPLDKRSSNKIKGQAVSFESLKKELSFLPFDDPGSINNASLSIAVAKYFLKGGAPLKERISSLPKLALRLETFDGIFGNTIINDTYNLDLDALRLSLDYQLKVAGSRKRIVIVGLDSDNLHRKNEIEQMIEEYRPHKMFVFDSRLSLDESFYDSVVLIKGTRKADMQRVARKFRLKNHKTTVEINLSALRNNLSVFKNLLLPETKLLAMVKAQSYGSGVEKMAEFLQNQGVDYLGVAYVDEGVELRKQGIKCPILVMNAEEEGFEDCIKYELEPAIYSLKQLDEFVKELIFQGIQGYPVHVKIDTGMKRLGFDQAELRHLCETLSAQPEIIVKSVYSHLADADNRRDKRYTELQISRFNQACHLLNQQLHYKFDRHLLNSEGIANFPESQFDMVRLGIGMYGLTSNPVLKLKLKPVLKWYSSVSQIKILKKGESAGYSRSYIAEKDTTIAIIPLGYADGFRRNLSNGKGGVYIKGNFCPVIGRVCMDMILVDTGKMLVKEGEKVEIIGQKQSIEKLANAMETIPYEVMTSIASRVHRVYVEE